MPRLLTVTQKHEHTDDLEHRQEHFKQNKKDFSMWDVRGYIGYIDYCKKEKNIYIIRRY